MKKISKIFFIVFAFFALMYSNYAQASAINNVDILKETIITQKENVLEIYDTKKQNTVLSLNSSKKLQALNKNMPHNSFLLSYNKTVLNKGSIFYFNSGYSSFHPASYSKKTNDIRAP